jgi:enoyl-CoA hydratase/carnithine racemase
MSQTLTTYDVAEHVATVTLNHPEKRNALSVAMLESLGEQFARAGADAQVRAVILRAVGPVFSAGHDLRELASATTAEVGHIFALCARVMEQIRLLPRPVIAQVHSLATAAGCQLVASCDLAVAAATAQFATPGVKVGLFCSTPAVPLCRAIPARKALEMLFTGEPISAQEAERFGLVNRVVPPEQLAEATLALARQITRASAAVMTLGKRAFYDQLPLDVPTAYGVAQRAVVANAGLPDFQEGTRAFLEKRPPQWQQ